MKKNIKLSALVLISGILAIMLSAYFVVGQGIEDTANWNKAICCGTALSVVTDSNSDVYVAGLDFLDPGVNWLIKKFDSDGVEDIVNWDKSLDFGTYGAVRGLAVDSKNDIYAVGYGSNLVSSTSSNDWVIKKFDGNGVEDTIRWNKVYGGPGVDYPTAIAIDSTDNIYVVGTGYNLISSSSGYDWWIKKFNRKGREDSAKWNKMYDGTGGTDHIESVAIDSNNNVYVAGWGRNLVSSTSKPDIWIKKFNSNGVEDTTNWNKVFDSGRWDPGAELAIDSNNNVYLAATGESLISSSSGYDWWIKKFNSDGVEDTVNWNKMYDAAGFDDGPTSIVVDSNNDIYIGGYGWHLVSNASGSTEGYDWWIKKFDSDGIEDTINWNKMYDGTNSYDIAQSLSIGDSGNSLYAVGTTRLAGSYNLLIKKFSIVDEEISLKRISKNLNARRAKSSLFSKV